MHALRSIVSKNVFQLFEITPATLTGARPLRLQLNYIKPRVLFSTAGLNYSRSKRFYSTYWMRPKSDAWEWHHLLAGNHYGILDKSAQPRLTIYGRRDFWRGHWQPLHPIDFRGCAPCQGNLRTGGAWSFSNQDRAQQTFGYYYWNRKYHQQSFNIINL